MISTSGKLTAQAFTSITIWPLRAVGRGNSPSVSVSGPPVAVDKRAFIIFSSSSLWRHRPAPPPGLPTAYPEMGGRAGERAGAVISCSRRAHPRAIGIEPLFISPDRGVALFGQRTLVEPFAQAPLAERVDLEGDAILQLSRHRQLLQVEA